MGRIKEGRVGACVFTGLLRLFWTGSKAPRDFSGDEGLSGGIATEVPVYVLLQV
jgi:hypothetical protein